jgi:hypothetical protein
MAIHNPSFRYCGGEDLMDLLVGTAARPKAKGDSSLRRPTASQEREAERKNAGLLRSE